MPSSSVTVTGNAGEAVGLGVATTALADGAVVGATDGDAPAPVQAVRKVARNRSNTATPRRRAGSGIEWVSGSGWPAGGVASDTQDPSLRQSKEGSGDALHVPAYLSLEGSSMHRGVGDRTSARGRFTVAGLCRNHTGLRDHAAFVLNDGRSVAHRIGVPDKWQ